MIRIDYVRQVLDPIRTGLTNEVVKEDVYTKVDRAMKQVGALTPDTISLVVGALVEKIQELYMQNTELEYLLSPPPERSDDGKSSEDNDAWEGRVSDKGYETRPQ